MSGSDSHCIKTQFGYQFNFSSGIPSPPSSESSRTSFFRTEGSQSQDTMAAPSRDRHSPPYPTPRLWTSPASNPMMPAPITSEAGSHDMALVFPIRQVERPDHHHRNTYYSPPYGSPAMPAPSQLLGTQMAGPSSYLQATRTPSTFQSLPRPAGTTFGDFSPISFPNHPSALPSFHSGPSTYQWQPPAYNQPYFPTSQTWSPHTHPQPYKSHQNPPSTLGALPQEAWQTIFRCLPYEDRLRLQRVNHFWHDSLVTLEDALNARPEEADVEDKVCLITAAENYRKHWAPSIAAVSKATNRGRPRNDKRKALLEAQAAELDSDDDGGTGKKRKQPPASIGNLGCYHCYKVLPGGEFCLKTDQDDNNPPPVKGRACRGSGIAPRRYCLQCGIKKGFHIPGKYYERKLGIEIWICLCLRIHEKYVMNCEDCGKMCPLTPVNNQSRGARGDIRRYHG